MLGKKKDHFPYKKSGGVKYPTFSPAAPTNYRAEAGKELLVGILGKQQEKKERRGVMIKRRRTMPIRIIVGWHLFLLHPLLFFSHI